MMQLVNEMEWSTGRMTNILGTTIDMSSSSRKDSFHKKKDPVCAGVGPSS